MQIEFEYELDHYGLDNWQAEWGNGDIERDIVVMYNTLLPDTRYEQVDFDYQVLMDGLHCGCKTYSTKWRPYD